jgi:hypothetical protein
MMSACGMFGRSPLLAVALMVALALDAGAAAIAPHIAAELGPARLAGAGSFTFFGLKIYDAQLWVGRQGYRENHPDANKFVLDLRYARKLSGQKIAAASADQMQKIGVGTPAQRQAWLVKMARLFPDVEAGTHLSGVLVPGEGARFYLNQKLLGEVADPAFARAFFAIWLAPASSAQSLRQALLADAAPRP